MSNGPAITMQELEREHAELLPSRETLWVGHCHSSHGFAQVGFGNTAQSGLLNVSAANGSFNNILSLGSGGVLGIVAAGGGPVALPTASPLLTVRGRVTLLPERAANALGAFFGPLFCWPAVAAVVASVAVLDYWLFAVHGLSAGVR